MFGADKGNIDNEDQRLQGKGLRIGIVQARFNHEVTNALNSACRQELLTLGVAERDIHQVSVPGALEVPVALQALAEQSKFDALIAIGCVIRGETYHFELVANESSAGVTRIALDFQIPIANAILTTENLSQAIARQSVKGSDAARVAIEMANLLEKI
jgi:6,7-dimethyl-8-ribityllumazine synthase